MTPHRPAQTPIIEFLGADAGIGGPFAVLGLLHDIESEAQIIRATNRRLQQIDRHPQRSTPDADEARLAVYAAATQLLDPRLRAELTRRWPQGTPVSIPQAWKPAPAASKLTPGFTDRARLLVGASGGWNSTARTRLAHFARVNRVAAIELVSALHPSTPSESIEQGWAAASARPQNAKPRGLIAPPPARQPQWIAAYAMLGLMALLVLSTVVLRPPGLGTGAGSNQPRTSTPSKASQGIPEAPRGGTPIERTELSHYTAIAHEIDEAARRAENDPRGALDRFATIYPLFVESWTSFPGPALDRGALHIAELTRWIASSETLGDELWRIFSWGRYESNPAIVMIRAAIIDVAMADPALGDGTRLKLASIKNTSSGYDPHPSNDVTSALSITAGLLAVDARTDDPVWWAGWIKGVRAATQDDQTQRSKLVLSALSARLRDQSPPDDAWSRSVTQLVSTLSWRAGTPEPYWMLSQFADDAVNTQRLSALTAALALNTGLERITAQMVLNPGATRVQRQEMAQKYRAAWAEIDPQSGGESRFPQLANELHLRVSITPAGIGGEQAITAMIELTRLNTAAWRFAAGKETLAAQTLGTVSDPIADGPAPQRLALDASDRDTSWAQHAVNAESTIELSTLFAQLVPDNGPGVNSAHALVYLATLHPDSDFRALATAQLVRYKGQVPVLIAVDHAIAGSRVSSRLESLVLSVIDAPLPSRTDDAWFFAAHRVLLERTAEALARSSESPLPALQTAIGASYADRLDPPAPSQAGDPSAIARDLYQQMLLDARSGGRSDPFAGGELDSIEAASAVRLARAPSPMHAFLAYQRGICELIALAAERDLAGASLPIRDVMEDLRTRLDGSDDVLGQMVQTERAIAEIWLMRLERGGQ